MRRINKGVPFDDFVEYLNKHKPSKWEDINGDLKSNMRLHMLVNEQDCLCGYSETILEAENTSSHIDHFVKRAHDSNKIFDWNNFIVSTIDEDYGGKYKDNTYKISKEEYAQIFNPVFEDMAPYIEYLGDGRIVPKSNIQDSESIKVLKTIEVFNLNSPSLKNKRRDLLCYLNDCSGLKKEDIMQNFRSFGFVSLVNWFINTLQLWEKQ